MRDEETKLRKVLRWAVAELERGDLDDCTIQIARRPHWLERAEDKYFTLHVLRDEHERCVCGKASAQTFDTTMDVDTWMLLRGRGAACFPCWNSYYVTLLRASKKLSGLTLRVKEPSVLE